ncbi:peptigoglycan-binding protein LysM [Sedimentitalea sp. CY04]|uniref:Peptigoglycan-binding protein LysM n=2 Tax=Parasedimentitalea denitrificans TaxID=2211118 RepID=A0ABX0W6L3_9RHOB|nr:peptigoglycan-binding protein LysM [Sedimentitalea sp. CY04]
MIMSDATFILAPSAAVDVVAEDTEQPEVVAVAQTDVTTDVPAEKTASADVVASVTSEVVEEAKVEAPSETVTEEVAEVATEGAAVEEVAEVAPVSDDPVEEVTEVAEVEDQPEEVIETAAVDVATVAPQPVAQPMTETAPEPEASPVAMAVLKSDSEGVELVQPATPVAPELLGKVSLDIISYSGEGDVQLAGRAGPGTLVRVYLDNSPVADIQSAKDGSWKGLLSDIAPGIYTLRLDELDTEGKVLSRLETPFKRESPEVLQPPAAPEDSPAEATPPIRAVTVQKGDTLWAISRERYGDGLLYVRVFEANQEAIRDPDLIYPGQIFSIPE